MVSIHAWSGSNLIYMRNLRLTYDDLRDQTHINQ